MRNPERWLAAPARLLTLVHHRGDVSRAEATAELGLARSAVGEAAAELVALGLVRQSAPQRPAQAPRGRPSPVLSANPDGPIVVAVELHDGGAQLAVMGLGGSLGNPRRFSFPDRGDDPEAVLASLAGQIRRLVTAGGRPCVGVGVGLAGTVRADDGFVRSAVHLGWADVPAAELLARHLPDGMPISVAKDAVLAAFAEHRRGAGRGARSLVVLTCAHAGIGGAVLQDGVPFIGAGHAMEAGHLSIDPGGQRCPCGQRGCLELYADGRALLRAAGAEEEHDVGVVFERAAEGDSEAVSALETIARALGLGLAGLANLLDPDRIVLSGFLVRLFRDAAKELHDAMAASVVARISGTEVRGAEIDHPVLVGAAEQAFAVLLSDPYLVQATSV